MGLSGSYSAVRQVEHRQGHDFITSRPTFSSLHRHRRRPVCRRRDGRAARWPGRGRRVRLARAGSKPGPRPHRRCPGRPVPKHDRTGGVSVAAVGATTAGRWARARGTMSHAPCGSPPTGRTQPRTAGSSTGLRPTGNDERPSAGPWGEGHERPRGKSGGGGLIEKRSIIDRGDAAARGLTACA